MESGESFFMKLFHVKKDLNEAEIKGEIVKRIQRFAQLKIPLENFKKIVLELENAKDNDKVNEYFEVIKKKISDSNDKGANLNDLIQMAREDLNTAEQYIQKIECLGPFIEFLTSECNINDDINNFITSIKKINAKNDKKSKIADIVDIGTNAKKKNIKKLLELDNAINIPSNVFYRFLLKQLFIDSKVASVDDLLETIKAINDKCKEKMNINSLKNLKVHDFDEEILKKTQDLMKKDKVKNSLNNFIDSNNVYKQIESSYRDFDDLSEDDDKFLHQAIIYIFHFDNFYDLGAFFNDYFKEDESSFERIKCLINPIQDNEELINQFQNFKKKYKKSDKNELFENSLDDFVKKKIKWPKLFEHDVKMDQASQFFTFWTCISKLISPFLEDENSELCLIPEISDFLEDKNKYTQFQQKMQQAYIEPTVQNYYVTFESIMKMLMKSDIANKDASFNEVSKNAVSFFTKNYPEFFKITNGIDSLLQNEQKINGLLTNDKTNVVIDEYSYVKEIIDKRSFWEISFENHIRLINKDSNDVVADFPKLRLVAAKLNIVMIETNNVTRLNELTNSMDFVNFFQIAETLYTKLSLLHQLKFDVAERILKYESVDSEKINDLIANLDKIIKTVNNFFSEVYKDELCAFTKEQFFTLYRLFNQYKNDTKKGKTNDLGSILAGTIISANVDDYYDLVKKEKYEKFNLEDNFNDSNIEKLENNLNDFSQALSNIIKKLRTKYMKKYDHFSSQLRNTENLYNYLLGGTVRCICLYPINNDDEDSGISSKFQMHSMILYLLFRYRSSIDSLPLPTQLLICSMSTSRSQIDSFLGYFNSMTEKDDTRCMFIVVSPIQLQPDLYDYLISQLKNINETVISQSRIVILYEYEDSERKKIFNDVIRDISVDHFRPVLHTENLKGLYQIDGYYGIQAYYIYQQFPRTGKTHRILNHIYDNYRNHIYTRILVDEATTLTTLINRLNAVPKGKEVGNQKIIIHFNVDGKCSTNFHLYIQNLAFFRSLNDGISIPFVVNDQMVFYFEFGSRPSFNKEQFIQNIFPIAKYIEEIEIPEPKEFFTYTEFITIQHEKIQNALKIDIKPFNRKYLIEAATIANLSYDENSFLRVNKSAQYVRYSDYIDYYKRVLDHLRTEPKEAYDNLLKMFENLKDKNNLLISQISDVAKVISRFKGPILSQIVYENEKGVGYNVRRFLVGLLIEAAITNCGLPYMPPMDGNKIIDSSEKDEQRLKRIKEFISRSGHMLTVCNPAGSPEDQSFSLIIDEDSDFINLLVELEYLPKDTPEFLRDIAEKDEDSRTKEIKEKLMKIEEIKKAIRSALKVVDPDWKKQECPDDLFKILADILNLQFYEREKFIITMIVDSWRALSDESRDILEKEWQDNIAIIKSQALNSHQIQYSKEIKEIYKNQVNTTPDFIRRKRIWFEVQDQLLNDKLFDISETEEKKRTENIIFVSENIYEFISNCEKYIQNADSLMLKYTLTSQNIKRFVHLVYRIYSNVPIVLMGETGSGKTFTLQFLSEIIGKNVQLIHHVIDGGTKEENLRAFLRAKIADLTNERSIKLKEKMMKAAQNPTTPTVIADSIKHLYKENELIHDFEDIKIRIVQYIDELSKKDLSNYNVTVDGEKEGLKKYVLFILEKLYSDIELEQKSYLLFFDEVNTAPCQWFIKEIILDRYFEGKILPHYIHFVCAVNPSRKLNKNLENVLDALTPIYMDDSQDDRKNLVYKVGQMPESFVPYLFPADPNRDFGSYNHDPSKNKTKEEYLYDINLNSEFDVSIDKKVESEFSLMTYPFIEGLTDDNYSKAGDKHHFSLTNKFSTSFDYSFINALFKDPSESLKFSRALIRLLSRINIFCCRLSRHVIYDDESFSSIRDPERCIRIMRWAYKFGIFERLKENIDKDTAIKRLRRAFIIGLSVSFWIRLSDQSPSAGEDSFRTMFIKKVCEYWNKLLEQWNAVKEVKECFKAPDLDEWTEIIDKECQEYVDIFVDNDECVSKNKALSENIWVSFICIMNNIPLWIIGKPGTSKSLALNIVINKLMNQNSRNEKITQCPPLVSQTFMCSNTTTTEAIMDQLGKIVDKSNMYNDNYIIRIQILEEIGHADMSRFKPLVCLHNIIDNGYPFRPGTSIPVHLIGLSNYKMDSAKLNRGILLLRCALDESAIKKTASDIFKSTNLALNQNKYDRVSDRQIKKFDSQIQKIGEKYQDKYKNSDDTNERPFIGLRDFYGLIQSLTKPITTDSFDENNILTIIRRNFSGIPFNKELKNDKTEEMIQSCMEILFKGDDFSNNKYFNKLILNDDAPNKKDAQNVTVYYNMSYLIADNLNQEHQLLKTPIFRHILISTVNAAALLILVQNKAIQLNNYKDDSPYELFFATNMSNLPDAEWISNELRRLTEIMYKGKIAVFIGKHPCFDSLYDIFNLRYHKEGSDGETETFVAMIAYGGDSYPTIVNSNFKAIIILESDVYQSLPQPFLNRFEKFNMTYRTELLPSVINQSKNDINSLKRKLQVQNLSSVFGCYSDELLLSLYHITNQSNDSLPIELMMLLSIRPSDLIYSSKNDRSLSDKLVISSFRDNPYLHSSLIHLLHGFNKKANSMDDISRHFYNLWKKNKGIKSIILLPSFSNIDKIDQYDFIRIDSSNSVNIDARIKSQIENIKKYEKQIIISILISQSQLTVDVILQYEFILETICNWCRKEKKIIKPIHTLILISMEHDIEGLKINQSNEWPLLYLDSCYDSTIKTNNNNGLPLDLSDLLFKPIKTLIDDELIDLDALFIKARESISPCYTNEENKLIDISFIQNNRNFEYYIRKPIKDLITKTIKGEDYRTAIEYLSDDFHNLWSFKQITLLSSPPSSLLEFLGLKLVKVIGDIMSIIFELLLSGINPRERNINVEKIFSKAEIFYFMMDRPEFSDLFFWILNGDSNQVYPIDYRFFYDVRLPGQLSFYKFVWQLGININNSNNIEDSKALRKAILSNLECTDVDIQTVVDDFNELMNSELDSDPKSICFPFIAAFLLNVADSVYVHPNHTKYFTSWISCFIEILKKLFKKPKSKLTMEKMMYELIVFRELSSFAHDFTIAYMFFPSPPVKNKEEFYDNIVPKEIFDDMKKCANNEEEYPQDKHLITEEAYLIHFITDNFAKTIKERRIEFQQANNLFRNEFSTLLARHTSLSYKDDYIDDYSYTFEAFSFICTLQQFFIIYGDKIFIDEEERVILNIHSNDFKEEKEGIKCIKNFVNEYYQYLKFNDDNIVEKETIISLMIMYYLETYNQIYQGIVDDVLDDFNSENEDDEGGEEDEEEAEGDEE